MTSKQILLLCIVMLALWVKPGPAQEQEFFAFKGLALGIGTLSPPIGLYQKDEVGNSNTFRFNFLLKIDSYHYISEDFTLSLGAGAELPSSDEVGNKKFPFYFTTRLRYDFPFFEIYVGNMFYFQNQFGTGESVVLNNGDGMSEFFLPDENRTSRNWIIELGATFYFTPDIFFEPTLLLVNITNSTKKNVGYLVTVNYFFDPSTWSTK